MIGIIFMVCLLCCVVMADLNKKEKETKTEDEDIKLNEVFKELRYKGHKEAEFWRYFRKRKKSKLTYIIPEFEKRINKMNKLKKKAKEKNNK